jgi:hypothetical protein
MTDGNLNSWVDDITQHEETLIPEESGSMVSSGGIPLAPLDLGDMGDFTDAGHALEDLGYLLDDILKAGGMSQSFAMEAQRLIPDFDHGSPIGFYTKEPTATRYTVSLEAITGGIWAAIVAASAALMYLLYRLIRWMLGKKADGATKDKGVAAMAQEIRKDAQELAEECQTDASDAKDMGVDLKKAADAAREVEFQVRRGVTIADSKGATEDVNSIDAIVDKLISDGSMGTAFRDLLRSGDAMMHDILDEGEYTQEVKRLADASKSMLVQMDSRVKAILAIFKQSMKNQPDDEKQANFAVANKQLASITGKITVSFDGGDLTLQEVNQRLVTKANSLKGKVVTKKLTLEGILNQAARASDRNSAFIKLMDWVPKSVGQVELLTKTIEDLEIFIGNAAADPTAVGMPAEHARPLRAALYAIHGDLIDLHVVYDQVNRYRLSYMYYMSEVIAFGSRFCAKMYSEIKGNGNIAAEKAMHDFQASLKETDSKRKNFSMKLRNFFKK